MFVFIKHFPKLIQLSKRKQKKKENKTYTCSGENKLKRKKRTLTGEM